MSTVRPLTTTWTTPDEHTAGVALDGDLDYETADVLLREVVGDDTVGFEIPFSGSFSTTID